MDGLAGMLEPEISEMMEDPESFAEAAADMAEAEEEAERGRAAGGPSFSEYRGAPSETDREAYERILREDPADVAGALFRFCFERDVFYHEKYAKACASTLDDDALNAMPQTYLDMLSSDPAFDGLTFFSQLKRENFEKVYSEDLTVLSLSAEDRKNRQQILSIVSYDPFEDEPAEDRPQMYRDLAGLLTDAMRRDIPKRNAAIEIVHDYTTIARYQRRMAQLEVSGNDDDETRERIDNCIKMISKMQDTINKLTKENGFSSGKAIGANGRGGLSDVMAICEERGYDPAAPNIYDMETSKAIEEVAEISFRAMLNQVNLSGTDYADILTAQCEKVREYRDAALRAIEAKRLAEEKLEKQAILEEYRAELAAKGINEKDIMEILSQEIHMVSGGK